LQWQCVNNWGVDTPLFFVYNTFVWVDLMDKEKIKLIVKNLESLVEILKSEIYSDTDTYKPPQYEQVSQHLTNYDEIFYDDDDE
jgi:hypothetical protein